MDTYKTAALTVLAAVREYLPPDGISKDELISRVIEAVDNPEFNEGMHKPRVMVKPLKWRESRASHEAYALFGGSYIITAYAGMAEPFKLEQRDFGGSIPTYHRQLSEAKAAAQADYERRILSAVET